MIVAEHVEMRSYGQKLMDCAPSRVVGGAVLHNLACAPFAAPCFFCIAPNLNGLDELGSRHVA
jgi:hypothetical protein